MLLAMWSAKGGVGLSVTAAATALVQAQERGASILIDLAGDQAAILGLAEPSSPGLYDWLGSEADSTGSLERLAIDTGTDVRLVSPGEFGSWNSDRVTDLVAAIAGLECPVIVDCGVRSFIPRKADPVSVDGRRQHLVEAICSASTPVLVSSPCYLALRRAVGRLRSDEGLPESGLVVVSEQGRALDAADVSAVTQLRLLAKVERDPAVARRVDAGQFLRRPPRTLLRSLEGLG